LSHPDLGAKNPPTSRLLSESLEAEEAVAAEVAPEVAAASAASVSTVTRAPTAALRTVRRALVLNMGEVFGPSPDHLE
jgi:hypothetical protein